MLTHYNETQHPICFSFADFSFWCYACEDYVVNPLLDHNKLFYDQKFGSHDTQNEILKKIKETKYRDIMDEADEDDEDD